MRVIEVAVSGKEVDEGWFVGVAVWIGWDGAAAGWADWGVGFGFVVVVAGADAGALEGSVDDSIAVAASGLEAWVWDWGSAEGLVFALTGAVL